MELILFCGIQGSGKSTFYQSHFFHSHVRISLDQLGTRNKEALFLETCFKVQQKCVIDNTNPTKEARNLYIEAAKNRKYKVIGYYFQSKLQDCLDRNTQRSGKAKIDERGILSTAKKLEIPEWSEGFDELYYVEISDENTFIVSPWNHEI
jgi:predicted kinase